MLNGEEAQALLGSTARFTASLAASFGYVEERPVTLRPIQRALITPATFPEPTRFTGAVYDGDLRLVPSSQRRDPAAPQPADAEILEAGAREGALHLPRAIYGGILFLVLGHFLFETAARLWVQVDLGGPAAPRDARLPVVFHPCDGFEMWAFRHHPFLVRSLAALGVDEDNLVLATQAISVDLLYYPETLSIYHEYVHPLMARVLDHIGDRLEEEGRFARLRPRRAPSCRRVFLSRARWTLNVRIDNEAEIEEVFRAQGFTILHPEEMTPRAVVRAMREAEYLASSDGSHAHLAAFARPGTRCLHLDTRPVPTQAAIERLRGLRAVHVPLFENPAGLWDASSRRVDPAKLASLLALLLAEVPGETSG
ncbi:glycosyltransferase family 61 protein [Methylobacterium sp. JK268]